MLNQLGGVKKMINKYNHKNLYEVISELAKEWSGLKDTEKTALVELLSGQKR